MILWVLAGRLAGERVECGSPEGLEVARTIWDVWGDPINQPAIARKQGIAHTIWGGNDSKGVDHLIANQSGHIAPTLAGREARQLLSNISPTVSFKNHPVGRRAGVEADLGTDEFPPEGGLLVILTCDNEDRDRDGNIIQCPSGLLCAFSQGGTHDLGNILGRV